MLTSCGHFLHFISFQAFTVLVIYSLEQTGRHEYFFKKFQFLDSLANHKTSGIFFIILLGPLFQGDLFHVFPLNYNWWNYKLTLFLYRMHYYLIESLFKSCHLFPFFCFFYTSNLILLFHILVLMTFSLDYKITEKISHLEVPLVDLVAEKRRRVGGIQTTDLPHRD